MKSEFANQLNKDREKILNAIQLQMPIVVTSYTLPRDMEKYIREVLSLFLTECRQDHLYEYLNFCLSELLTNAKKANTKRVYFKEKNLDINNKDDYERGMESFKEDTLTNIDHYLELQKKAGLYIKLLMQLKGDKVLIEIRNNAILNDFESARIQNKLESVQQYTSMEDAYANILDQSEGAGLGIIIIILMLEKVGLSRENYQVFVEDGETVTRIILPCNQKIFGGTDLLSYQFARLQETIPCLKDSYARAEKIVQADKINRNELYKLIRKDTMLSVLLLKTALKKFNESLNLAKVLDLFSDEELKEIYTLENPEVSIVRTNVDSVLWVEHARNVAFYAYNIAKNFDLNNNFTPEEMYTLGLLNSIGIIIMKTASDEQKECIEQVLESYDIADKIRTVFYSGIESGYLGMVYAKKLGFKENVHSIFGFWNNSDRIAEEMLPSHNIVYLAEVLQYYDEGKVEFYQLDRKILKQFNIVAEEQFISVLNQLKYQDA